MGALGRGRRSSPCPGAESAHAFEVPSVTLFEVGSQFRFRSGVESVGTGTGNMPVCCMPPTLARSEMSAISGTFNQSCH